MVKTLRIFVGERDSPELSAMASGARGKGFKTHRDYFSANQEFWGGQGRVGEINVVEVEGGIVEVCVAEVALESLRRGIRTRVNLRNCRTDDDGMGRPPSTIAQRRSLLNDALGKKYRNHPKLEVVPRPRKRRGK